MQTRDQEKREQMQAKVVSMLVLAGEIRGVAGVDDEDDGDDNEPNMLTTQSVLVLVAAVIVALMLV